MLRISCCAPYLSLRNDYAYDQPVCCVPLTVMRFFTLQKFIDADGRHMWDVRGVHVNGPFHFRCKKVVLATGLKNPRLLHVRDARAIADLDRNDL